MTLHFLLVLLENFLFACVFLLQNVDFRKTMFPQIILILLLTYSKIPK